MPKLILYRTRLMRFVVQYAYNVMYLCVELNISEKRIWVAIMYHSFSGTLIFVIGYCNFTHHVTA